METVCALLLKKNRQERALSLKFHQWRLRTSFEMKVNPEYQM